VMQGPSLAQVVDAAGLLIELGCERINVKYPLPLGLAGRADYKWPSLAELRSILSELARRWPGRLTVHNLPPCLFPRLAPRLEFATSKQAMEMASGAGRINFGEMLSEMTTTLPQCEQCTQRIVCEGVPRMLLARGARPAPGFSGLPRRPRRSRRASGRLRR